MRIIVLHASYLCNPRSIVRRLILTTLAIALLSALSGQAAWSAELSFASDIRPIFSNKCFACHGPDEQTREGGFRLDIKDSAMGLADSGETPIVAGDLDGSELWRRINSHEDDEVMPPPDQERRLTSADISLLKAWIEQGAPWEEHWSFTTPVRPEAPRVQNESLVYNPIDWFVLGRLESIGKRLATPASKTTLIRRVTFDLIGLPPTPEEVDAFLADKSPYAYDKLVDRLLNSPHYGEHMATDWLDGARFADTNGYQNDFARKMWPWRDWVINTFNRNLPYDQFTIEQLAGDLLADPTPDQIIATGFNRNHRTVTEAGSINDEWLVENVVDRIETTSTVFLGLTFGCARCHDHKYDPISQREFYQMFAYFYNVDEKGVNTETRGNVPPLHFVLTKEQQSEQDKLDEERAAIEAEIEGFAQKLPAQQAEWEESFATEAASIAVEDHQLAIAAADIQPLPPEIERRLADKLVQPSVEDVFPTAISFDGTDEGVIDLGDAFEFHGEKPFSGSVWAYPEEKGVILSRMDAKNHARGFDWVILGDGRIAIHLIHKFPGDALKITTEEKLESRKWNHIAVTYDGSKKASGFQVFLNTHPAIVNAEMDSLEGDTTTEHPLWLGHRKNLTRLAGQLSDLKLFHRTLQRVEIDAIFRSSIHGLRSIPKADRTSPQQDLVDRIFREHVATDYAGARRRLGVHNKQQREFVKDKPSVMVMKELAQPRETFVLMRGQYDKPNKDQQVYPGVPDFLPQLAAGLPPNRLGLAKWIVARENPLTARVAVNRFWQQCFGKGLVESTENFGTQCPPPLQADLLDWLAVEFMESGWDIKALLRQIVTSATYRQSSEFQADAETADPNNRMFARGPRVRLSSEAIRDNALAIGGLLVRDIGGPSIKPYQPEGVWAELAGGAGEDPYVQDEDEKLYRRSLYIYRKRTVPHPTMSTFDAPSREICQVARQRTNTPLQALALLNDVTYVEAARQLAILALENGGASRENQLTYAFRRATGRGPVDRELQILASAFDRYEKRFSDDQDAASAYIAIGNSAPPSDLPTDELAALTSVASLILNLDETITKE